MPLIFGDNKQSNIRRVEEANKLIKIILALPAEKLDDMSDRDKEFFEKWYRMYDRFGAIGYITPNELAWLRDIKDKLI